MACGMMAINMNSPDTIASSFKCLSPPLQVSVWLSDSVVFEPANFSAFLTIDSYT